MLISDQNIISWLDINFMLSIVPRIRFMKSSPVENIALRFEVKLLGLWVRIFRALVRNAFPLLDLSIGLSWRLLSCRDHLHCSRAPSHLHHLFLVYLRLIFLHIWFSFIERFLDELHRVVRVSVIGPKIIIFIDDAVPNRSSELL